MNVCGYLADVCPRRAVVRGWQISERKAILGYILSGGAFLHNCLVLKHYATLMPARVELLCVIGYGKIAQYINSLLPDMGLELRNMNLFYSCLDESSLSLSIASKRQV